MSVGYGFGLLALVLVGAFFAERRWLRYLCIGYAALYFIACIGDVLWGTASVRDLAFPLLFVCFALFLSDIKKNVDKW